MNDKTYHIATELQQKITAEQAFHYRIVPIAELEDALILRTDHEVLENLLLELQIVMDMPIRLEHCAREELQKYLAANYRQSQHKET